MNTPEMSLKDLQKLQDDLQKLQKKVTEETEAYRSNRLSEAREAYAALIKESGFTIYEIIGKKSYGESPAKYQNPSNTLETWSGYGRRPIWLKNALVRGESLNTFLIDEDLKHL